MVYLVASAVFKCLKRTGDFSHTSKCLGTSQGMGNVGKLRDLSDYYDSVPANWWNSVGFDLNFTKPFVYNFLRVWQGY